MSVKNLVVDMWGNCIPASFVDLFLKLVSSTVGYTYLSLLVKCCGECLYFIY